MPILFRDCDNMYDLDTPSCPDAAITNKNIVLVLLRNKPFWLFDALASDFIADKQLALAIPYLDVTNCP